MRNAHNEGVVRDRQCSLCGTNWKLHIRTFFRRSVTGLWQRRHEFNPKSVRMGFVVDKVALWEGFFPVLWFSPLSIIPPMLHTHLSLNTPCAFIRRTSGRSLGSFKKAMFFRTSRSIKRKIIFNFFWGGFKMLLLLFQQRCLNYSYNSKHRKMC